MEWATATIILPLWRPNDDNAHDKRILVRDAPCSFYQGCLACLFSWVVDHFFTRTFAILGHPYPACWCFSLVKTSISSPISAIRFNGFGFNPNLLKEFHTFS